MPSTFFSPGHNQVYVRSLGRDGAVIRAVGTLQRLDVRHEPLDVTSWGGPQQYLTGPTTLDISVRCYGSDTCPTGDHPGVPLTEAERLAFAILDGNDDAVYPLIDEFLMSRGK